MRNLANGDNQIVVCVFFIIADFCVLLTVNLLWFMLGYIWKPKSDFNLHNFVEFSYTDFNEQRTTIVTPETLLCGVIRLKLIFKWWLTDHQKLYETINGGVLLPPSTVTDIKHELLFSIRFIVPVKFLFSPLQQSVLQMN